VTEGVGLCPACGGPLGRWMQVPGGEPSDPRLYQLLRCERCGSAVTEGEPPGAAFYETGVYAPGPPRAPALVRALQRVTTAQPARLLRRAGVAPGARVLDAGAGRGRLVAELQRRGYHAAGIEPSTRGAGSAAAAGLAVRAESLADHEDRGLDAVVLWHVLEHIEDPLAALRHVREWLTPGGAVLVAVPNASSLQARVAGGAWLHWDAPRHRVHLTTRGLGELLDRAGLRTVRTSHMVLEHNPSGMWMALLSRLGMSPAFPFHFLKRNAPARPRDLALLALGVPMAPLAVGLEAAAAAARRGGTVALVARAD
jgi:SAM-dependent methyltransferase